MKLSVCTDAVYMGRDITEAAGEIKKQQIEAIEFWSWEDKDINRLETCMKKNELQVAALCTGFISLVDKNNREAYIEALKRTIETAKRLGCRCIITQTGSELDMDRCQQHRNLVDGLKACVPYLQASDMLLVVEPLNTRVDHAGYYLSSSDEAAEIIEEVGSPHVKMLFDIYHQQITEGDLIRRIRKYIPYIGHFHAAGNPGRHELYDSEIDYKKIFQAIQDTGYEGYIGLEYFPRDCPHKGIEFAKQAMEGR